VLAAIASSLKPSQNAVYSGGTTDEEVWDKLAACESGSDWHVSSGNGFYGGLQFQLTSWQLVGGSGLPNQASREEQIERAKMLLSRQGWAAWPVCSMKIGVS